MKKILTLNNIIALLGILVILLFLTPAFNTYLTDMTHDYQFNLFQATFGMSNVPSPNGLSYSLASSAGLITAFVLAVVAIVLSVCRSFCKYTAFFTPLLFIGAGVLEFCGIPLLKEANFNLTFSPSTLYITMTAWPIVIGVVFCLCGALSFIDMCTLGSSKQTKEVY